MRRTIEEGFEPEDPVFQAKRQELKDSTRILTQPIVDEIARLKQAIEIMTVSEEAAASQNTDLIRGGLIDPRRLNQTPSGLKKINLTVRLEGLELLLKQLATELEDTAMDVWKSEKRQPPGNSELDSESQN